jgi:hypothetical protein
MKNIKKTLGIATIIAGLTAGYLYNSHNPTNYQLRSTEDIYSSSIDTLLVEPQVDGEKNYDILVSEKTVDEIKSSFSDFYKNSKGENPNNSNVTEKDILNFSVDYVKDKLSFRYSVLFNSYLVKGVRLIPGGETLFPSKQNEYFQKLGEIDIAGETERLTDCWDYSQLFKETYNLLSSQYNLGSTSYRVSSDTKVLGLNFGEHDFNLIVSSDGTEKYIDTNAQDTWLINNPLDITAKVRD